MNTSQLLANFDRISDAPDAIPHLRRFILDLAVRGRACGTGPERLNPPPHLLKRIKVKKTESRDYKRRGC